MPLFKAPTEKEGPHWICQANRVFVQLDLYTTIRRLGEWKVLFRKSLSIGITGRIVSLVLAANGPIGSAHLLSTQGTTLHLPMADTSINTRPELLEACGFPDLMPYKISPWWNPTETPPPPG